MCINCVSQIDSAAAAVGGLAGLRAWLGTRTQLLATPTRQRVFMLVMGIIAVGVAGGALTGTG